MIRITIPATPTTWDYNKPSVELRDWMRTSVGRQCFSMSSLKWFRSSSWYIRFNFSKNDLSDISYDVGFDEPLWLHFYFNDFSRAIIFKLTWGGNL